VREPRRERTESSHTSAKVGLHARGDKRELRALERKRGERTVGDMVKSLFLVEWWLREAEGVTKPHSIAYMVFTRENMQNFAREEREKDRQYNVVYYWKRYER